MNFLNNVLKGIAISCILTGTFNYIVDPYGAFGDKYLNMPSYSLTMNQKIVKTNYIEKNYEKYNTYILGGSKAGAIQAEDVNKAYKSLNVKAYNMMSSIGEFEYYEDTINYLIDNCHTENIILQLSVLETKKYGAAENPARCMHYKVGDISQWDFFRKYLSTDMRSVAGKLKAYKNEDYEENLKYDFSKSSQNRKIVLNKIKEKGADYYIEGSGFKSKPVEKELTGIEGNLKALKRIVDKCKKSNVNFILISAPTSNKEFMIYPKDKLKEYMIELANICPYWNFTGYNDESYNYWNFYDVNHYREELAKMMLTKMTGEQIGSVPYEEIPENFGVYINSVNAEQEIEKAFTMPLEIENSNEYKFGMTFGVNRWEQ